MSCRGTSFYLRLINLTSSVKLKKHMHIFLCCEHLQHMCCQTDMDVFLICWSFLYLRVFSEVAAR